MKPISKARTSWLTNGLSNMYFQFLVERVWGYHISEKIQFKVKDQVLPKPPAQWGNWVRACCRWPASLPYWGPYGFYPLQNTSIAQILSYKVQGGSLSRTDSVTGNVMGPNQSKNLDFNIIFPVEKSEQTVNQCLYTWSIAQMTVLQIIYTSS